MGLIDKEKLKQELDFKSFNEEYTMSGGLWISYRVVEEVIDNQPEQPSRQKGHWVGIDDEPCDVYECDRCGTTYDTVDNTWDLPNFCPNCGADMREENNESN